MTIYELGERKPRIPESAFVAETAAVIGDVVLGENSSVWPGAVIRGDNDPIRIGARVNVQDGAVLHSDPGFPLTIGEGVLVGHQAMLHGCTIGENTLVGIQSVILNGAVIGRNSMIGAGSVVPGGKTFPERSLLLGIPAKVVRQLSDDEVEGLRRDAETYVRRRGQYKAQLKRIG